MKNADTPHLSPAHIKVAGQIFLTPTPTYEWDQIIEGVMVAYPDGSRGKRKAVDQKTFRGFYRLPGVARGAQDPCDAFFLTKKAGIRLALNQVSDREGLHRACESWRRELKSALANRIIRKHLEPYGKTRKVIDLYVMNLVAHAKELSEFRERLVPLLFLPLDKHMFEKAFTHDELRRFGLSPNSTYGDVKEEATYMSLQKIVQSRTKSLTKELGRVVHPIYFDMKWRNRPGAQAGNLFSASS